MSAGRQGRNFFPCPTCGKRGTRVAVIERKVGHAAALHRRSWIIAQIGVYKARCTCCKYFRAGIKDTPKHGHYSYTVREVIANSLIRDRMAYRAVIKRMAEDFHLSVSLGYVHQCFLWAHEQINTPEYRRWVVENFSGVLCLDEVHDSGRMILFATDPLNDFTVWFEIVDKNDSENMTMFLEKLKKRGITPAVVITDGSPLYKSSLQDHWADIEHQLCIFHVIRDVNKLILDGVRAIKNRIKEQGNKGRRKKRGRPKKGARRREERSMRRKGQAAFIWEHQHLIVKKHENMSRQEKETLTLLYRTAPALKLLRRFNRQFYRLFEKGISKEQARRRRRRMVNNPAYQANEFLAKALRMLKKENFEKMIVFMDWQEMERTNNHVERNNRVFRMLQKTRYKRRKAHTITKALELELYSRMLEHDLYQSWSKKKPIVSKDDLSAKEAA